MAQAQTVSQKESISDSVDQLVTAYKTYRATSGLRGRSDNSADFQRRVGQDITWFNRDKLRAHLSNVSTPPQNLDIYEDYLALSDNAENTEALNRLVVASQEGEWQRRHLANTLLVSYYYYRQDVFKSIEHVQSSLNIIPANDLSEAAYWARYQSWDSLGSMYTVEYDLIMVLESTVQKLEYAKQARARPKTSDILYNPIIVLAFHDEFEKAHELSTLFLNQVQSQPSDETGLAYHARARMFAMAENHKDAIPAFEDAIANHTSDVVKNHMRLQLAASLAKSGSVDRAVKIVESVTGEPLDISATNAAAKTVLIEKAAADADFQTAYTIQRRVYDAETARLRRRIGSAARASKLAVTMDSEVLDARTAEEAATIETALIQQELAETRAFRAIIIAALVGLLAFVSIAAAIHIRKQWKVEQRLRIRQEELTTENQILGVRAQAAARAKQQFISMMSHEFRTPLNHIMPVVDNFLAHNREDPKGRVLAKIIDEAAHRVLRMIDEINMLAGGTDTLRDHPDEFAIEDILALIETEKSKGYVLNSSLKLHIERLPGLPTHIAADEAKLGRILLALLENGLKFGEDRPVTLRLGFETDPDGTNGEGTLIFEVIDQGGGIPKARLDTLMQPFTQADMSMTRPQDGLGIGLTLVSLLCRVTGAKFGMEGDYELNGQTGVRAIVRAPVFATDGTGTWEPTPETELQKFAREEMLAKAA